MNNLDQRVKRSVETATGPAWRRARRALLSVLAAATFGGLRAQTLVFAPLAGNPALLDHTDGTGTNARFFNPVSAAVDSSGNIYIADAGDHTVRKVTSGGVVTTLAGTSGVAGAVDGNGTGAQFTYPYGIAVDSAGNVYVSDTGTQTIRKITPGGGVSTIAGSDGVTGSVDGTGSAALFNGPQGVAVDSSGNVYVSDTNNCTIRRITSAGVVSTFAGSAGQVGNSDGAGGSARFNYPAGLSIDTAGNVYVADFANSTVRKITPAGAVTTIVGAAGQSGTTDGPAGSARLNHPQGIAVDPSGNVYIIDTSNQTVREFLIGTGGVVTLAGNPGFLGHSDGGGASATFFYPGGIGTNGSGTIYIADTGNHRIRAMTTNGSVSTLAGSAGPSGSTDGSGTSASFLYPDGVAVDSSGNVYVADSGNNTIRKITASGSVSTLAGTANPLGGSADGTAAAARFNNPTGVAVDSSGNVYVADSGNSTIRKIAGGIVSTFAGAAGATGSSDGSGSAARFNSPQGIAVDGAGNVYVADTNNSTVREITSAGAVTTLAGAAGQTGSSDGTGGGARFNGPYAVAVDGGGNVYVADYFNATIRKIAAGGAVTTLAGAAGKSGDVDGVGAVARFNQTYGIAADGSGNLYVTDTYNRTVRKVSAGGSVSTLTGVMARFYYPQGIAISGSGTIYVADGDNQAISAGAYVTAPSGGGTVASQAVSAGANATFSIAAASGVNYQWQVSTDGGNTWTNVANGGAYSGATTTALTITGATAAMNGYQYRVAESNAAGTSNSGAGILTLLGSGSSGARLVNLSARSFVGTGANNLIAGFTIGGSGSKQLILRGVGPTLASFGVTGVLAAPNLTLVNSAGAVLAFNSGWGGGAALSTAFAAVGAFALPATSADAAMSQTLAAGGYTEELSGINSGTGVGLAEIYDADTGTPSARLTNISARAQVGTGANILVAGFVVTGTGSENLVIRGIGPTLAQFSVTGVLATPVLTIYNNAGTQIASNTGWGGTAALTAAFVQVGAFALPATSADSALIISLPAGNYSAQLAGANSSTGVGLLEIYELH